MPSSPTLIKGGEIMGLLFPKKNELFMTHLAGIDQYHEGWALNAKLKPDPVKVVPKDVTL